MNESSVTYLAEKLRTGFPREVTHRRIGREAEFPLVLEDGSAADVESVLRQLFKRAGYQPIITSDGCVGAQTDHFSVMTEVGRATIEIVFDPVDDLHAVNRLYQEALHVLDEVTGDLGMTLLFCGVHPTVPASDELMTDKARYRVLRQRMDRSWLWFTVTAGDQTHIDVAQDELEGVFVVANRLTPVVLALCGNSAAMPMANGEPVVNQREKRMEELLEAEGLVGRHGQFPEGLATLEDYVRHIADRRLLALDASRNYEDFDGSFSRWASTERPDFAQLWNQFVFHEHYVWPSARLRTRTGTIELRAACQQPRNEHIVAAALHLGLVESWRDLQDLHPDDGMRRRALNHGLDLPARDLAVVKRVLDVCESALQARGRGEEVYLRPLRQRFADRMNPGQRRLKAVAMDNQRSEMLNAAER